MKGFKESIREMISEHGMPDMHVENIVREFLKDAYKKQFDGAENAEVIFSDYEDEVSLNARKTVVEEVMDETEELSLAEAKAINSEAELGDEFLLEIDPSTFSYAAIQVAKQRLMQRIKGFKDDAVYEEFKDYEGKVVAGYLQRSHRGDLFIALKDEIEGILPRKNQSDRESFQVGERVKVLVYKVEKPNEDNDDEERDGKRQDNRRRNRKNGTRILLSRSHSDFVQKLFELEVPELADGSVQIFKVVREAGRKTKMAVYTEEERVDPVGACVGMKGSRIRNIISELEGEKIDVLPYSSNPIEFITSALAPAQVDEIAIIDQDLKKAIAIVDESQLALAIGRQGVNIRLASALCDWTIDVKTRAEFDELDIVPVANQAIHAIFDNAETAPEHVAEDMQGTSLLELPEISSEIIMTLRDNGVKTVEALAVLDDEALMAALLMDIEKFRTVRDVLKRYIVVEEVVPELEPELEAEADLASETTEGELAQAADDDEDEYECPECSATITLEMDTCPECGVEFAFEEEEE